jgi:hypothetical protein
MHTHAHTCTTYRDGHDAEPAPIGKDQRGRGKGTQAGSTSVAKGYGGIVSPEMSAVSLGGNNEGVAGNRNLAGGLVPLDASRKKGVSVKESFGAPQGSIPYAMFWSGIVRSADSIDISKNAMLQMTKKQMLEFIGKIYTEKILTDEVDDRAHMPRQTLSEFLYDYHLELLSEPLLAEEALINIVANVSTPCMHLRRQVPPRMCTHTVCLHANLAIILHAFTRDNKDPWRHASPLGVARVLLVRRICTFGTEPTRHEAKVVGIMHVHVAKCHETTAVNRASCIVCLYACMTAPVRMHV